MVKAIHRSTVEQTGLPWGTAQHQIVCIAAGESFRYRYDRHWDINNPQSVAGQEQVPVKLPDSVNAQAVVLCYDEPVVASPGVVKSIMDWHKPVYLSTFGLKTPSWSSTIVKQLAGVVIAWPSLHNEFYFKMYYKQKRAVERLAETTEWWLAQSIPLAIQTIVIPGENDSYKHLMRLAEQLHTFAGITHWQLQRFYPGYEILDKPPTDLTHLQAMHRELQAQCTFPVTIFDPGVNL